jgi:uncharacterized protein YfiM (DUF2279 family)
MCAFRAVRGRTTGLSGLGLLLVFQRALIDDQSVGLNRSWTVLAAGPVTSAGQKWLNSRKNAARVAVSVPKLGYHRHGLINKYCP